MGDFLGAVTPYQRELLEEQEQLGADVPVDAVSVADIVQPVEPTGTALPASSDEPKLDLLGTALNLPVPFAYGRHLVAGAPMFEHKLATTGQTVLFIALGEGEWDGAEVVWVNGAEINIADTNLFHFHPGFDGETGTETTPATPNQKICNFFPAGFTGMTFSKTAYIALTLPADPTAPGPEFDIRGIYKTRKVRTFDTSGNQTGYLFSANPAWQLLDAFISLHLKPHGLANEALVTAEKDRIDFAAFKAAADFCDVDIGGGVKRFESHVVFLDQTNLGTIFETLTALCRGYMQEQDGKLGLFIDQARSSVITFHSENILASTFQMPAKPLRSLANRLIIKARDIESGGGTVSKDFAPWTKTLDDEPHQDRIGRIIKKEFDLGANSRERAERVGRYWMERSLKLSEQGRLIVTPDAGAVMPGDRVTGPARMDFSQTRDWEVIEISDNPDGTREVFLQAYDESIFSDTAETQQDVEETTIPTNAQTAVSPTGTHFYLRAVFKPDQFNGSANVGEIDFDPRPSDGDYLIGHPDGTEFIIANTNRSLMSQGAQESYTGRVFIVFSKQKVNSERSLAALQDSRIIVLRLNTSGAWEYDNNTTWVAFTPDPTDILIFEVDRSGSGWAGKPTRYVGQELLSATEAGRLQYASGKTVEELEPGEPGANVTETRTAALIASQGALATKSNVDLGTAEVLNKNADNIAETGAKKWAGETGADITEDHVDMSTVVGTTSSPQISDTASVWKDIPEMTKTITINGGLALVIFRSSFVATAADFIESRVLVDGSVQTGSDKAGQHSLHSSRVQLHTNPYVASGIADGSRVIKMQGRSNGTPSAGKWETTRRTFQVVGLT